MSEYNREPRLQAELQKALAEQVGKEVKQEGNIEQNVPTSSEVVTESLEISEVERKARELGWKSKEEREAEGKSNTYYVEPEEYVRRQPLFARIEKQNNELRELKESQRKQQEYLAKVRKESYEQALRDIETRREAAVMEANTEEFRRLDTQHRKMQEDLRSDPMVNQAQVPQISEDLQAFVGRNSNWYNETNTENAKMKAAAEAVDNYLTRQAKIDNRQIDVKEHLSAIESEVKRLFPHRFTSNSAASGAPISPSVVNTVARSTAPVKETRGSNNLVSRLTPQQRALGESFQKSNKEYTLEVYAAELEKRGRLGR